MHGTARKRQLQPLHGISQHGMPSLQDFTARHGIARKVPEVSSKSFLDHKENALLLVSSLWLEEAVSTG